VRRTFDPVDTPRNISVIVPAYNAERVLPLCLEGLKASAVAPCEIIVVDDASTDRTAQIAEEYGARVLRMSLQSGPGAARNRAAEVAAGEILLFVDSDVVVKPDIIGRIAADLALGSEYAAVFGSYDEEPAERNFLSQYKNLQHYFVHQLGNEEAATFWAGCGAVLRDVFLELGGFDLERYPIPSIEDIELGYRLRAAGHRILLDKSVKAKHLKRWTLRSLIHTDIFCRAVPWSRLILESRTINADLNLRTADRISSALAWLMVLLVPLSPFFLGALVVLAVCFLLLLWLNREIYGFFLQRRGLIFTLRAIPIHLLYYLYSASTFAICWAQHKLSPARS